MLRNFLTSPIVYILFTFLILMLNTAWIGDDAMITIAQVMNFQSGNGLVLNYGERVQSFTHVTWFFLIAFITIITNEYYLTLMLLGIICSLTSLYIIYKYALKRNLKRAGYVIFILLFCNAFIDYSTSGLENSLSYLFFGIMLYMIFLEEKHNQKYFFKLFILMALIFLNRMDHIFILLPITLWYFYYYKWISIKPALIVIIIPLLWFLFSLFYFGQLFPQTYYAKLGAFDLQTYITKGIEYYSFQLTKDPLILFVLLLGIITGIYLKRKALMIALGIILYMIYIIKIGGDFMMGRYFSTISYIAVFLAVIYIVKHNIQLSFRKYQSYFINMPKNAEVLIISNLLIILICAIFILANPIKRLKLSTLERLHYEKSLVINIADERGYYFKHQSFLAFLNHYLSSNENIFPKRKSILMQPTNSKIEPYPLGLYSILLETNVYRIESWALSMPFLSRQKVLPQMSRIGHIVRYIPKGFKQASVNDSYQMPDPVQQYMWDIVKLVTRGNLFDWERIKAIYIFNQIKNYEDAKFFLKEL